jgi:DNA modification methylase
MSDWKMVKMQNEKYYTRDASEPFLAPESVDLFVTHPPYFNAYSDPHGKPEGQLQNASDREYFVDKIIKIIKHMEIALKPTGTIAIGFPTDENFYKVIAGVARETNLKFGPLFFWDFSETPGIQEIVGEENNIFLNLHKGNQKTNLDYKLDSYALKHPWVLSEDLESHSHLAFIHNSSPEIVYERMIGRYSKEGDVVADLMAGTGSVLGVATKMGRKFVYNDISPDQLEMAKRIIEREPESDMELRKSKVVELMTKEVQDATREQMEKFSTPLDQQEQLLRQGFPEVNRINGRLFDLLVKHGIIK